MSSEFQMIYPSFVLHKRWDMPETFNAALGEIAREGAKTHRVTDPSDPRNLGNRSNHFGHVRHNLLNDHQDHSAVQTLIAMTRAAIREFLYKAYRFDYDGKVSMTAETFYQQRAGGENVGIFTHTHLKSDLVCTYYPVVDLDEGFADAPLHSGALRFYDPAGKGGRLWKNFCPNHFIGSWYQVIPGTGSMIVFEGHVPHDSSFFEGRERICIPIQCDLALPNRQQKSEF